MMYCRFNRILPSLVILLVFILGFSQEGAGGSGDSHSVAYIVDQENCRVCHVRSPVAAMSDEEDCGHCHAQDPLGRGVSAPFAPIPVARNKPLPVGQATGKGVGGETILIPAGPFLMGYDKRHPDEGPSHTVTLPAFYIDREEVTNRQYKRFVDATQRVPPEYWRNGVYPDGKDDHPVTFVTWYDAHDYCAWVGRRLPTEEEWEKAARGTDGRLFPWGNEFDPEKANTPQSKIGDTTPVGRFPEGSSPYGLYDMGGNVWEWTESWAVAYPGNARPTAHYYTGGYKVLRGGSWVDCSFYRCGISAFTFNRSYFRPETKNKGFGFRCARSP